MQFDEYDEDLMKPLAETISKLAAGFFPETILVGAKLLKRTISAAPPSLESFIDVVDTCMGKLYVKHKGKLWKEEKSEEFLEVGLVFIWYSLENKISAFIAFKPVEESYGKTLYLYEIQILPEFQGDRFGATLMHSFHRLASYIDTRTEDSSLSKHEHLETDATSLTVFADNTMAFQWYKRLGYTLTDDSPVDRVTRKRTVKPDYYLMSREIDTHE